MNENNESKILIEAFKTEVKKKLPFWLKTNVVELKDFLDELEDHIWDKASELSESKDPQVMHVREAIILMGSPKKIAKEFRTRGTPKFYITEELWPWYYRSLIFAGIVSILVNMITMAFELGKGSTATIVGTAFWEIFVGFAFAFVGITVIFVQLSYHGFLPEDLIRIVDEEKKTHPKKKPKKEKLKKPKAAIPTSGSYLFEGIIGLVLGAVLIFYPFSDIIPAAMVGFPLWLQLAGGVMVLGGVLRFSQALVGKRLRLQQMFLALHIIPTSLHLALWLRLLFNPDLFQNFLATKWTVADVPKITRIVVILGAVLSILGMLQELSKIYKLEMQGFTPDKKSYEDLINGK